MDVSVWRRRSRIVAFVDLGLSTVGLFLSVMMIFLGGVGSAVLLEANKQNHAKNPVPVDSDITAFLVGLWVAIAIMAIIVCVDLWAVIMLLKATTPDADPEMALRRAQIWRNVNIVFLILGIIFYAIITGSYGSVVVEIIFRGTLLFVVYKFIEELRFMIDTSFPGTPDTVVINK